MEIDKVLRRWEIRDGATALSRTNPPRGNISGIAKYVQDNFRSCIYHWKGDQSKSHIYDVCCLHMGLRKMGGGKMQTKFFNA